MDLKVLETKYNGRKIGDMNWEELINALYKASNKKTSIPKTKIKKIIELTAHEDDNGDVWGDDIPLGTMDELINDAIKIINNDE